VPRYYDAPMDAPALRSYQLADNLGAQEGAVFLTGTQALVRLMLMQRRAMPRPG
jgi:indolepyruvate ferredoxin oxidoreductase